MNYPPTLAITPSIAPVDATVVVPGSKSITNRALVLGALTPSKTGVTLKGVLRSDDTEVMVDSLVRLGFQPEVNWESSEIKFPPRSGPTVPATSADLFVGNSGTTMRFLTALCAAGKGRFRLDGVERMRERPIADLLEALNLLPGVRAYSEANNGCPPVVVESEGLRTDETIPSRADVSSQFLSGLLMVSPHIATQAIQLGVEGPIVSEPYVKMTCVMMRAFGYRVNNYLGNNFLVHHEKDFDPPAVYAIEPDASAASYFWGAAAMTGGRVTVRGLRRDSLQGDVRFVELLERMGCAVSDDPEGLTVRGGQLYGMYVDMNDISDTVMTVAVLACFAKISTHIRNVAHIRHKETDRIAALATELRRLGAKVKEHEDGIEIIPGKLHGATVQTYQDHRMAMSMALIGLKVPGVVIEDPGCVAKTYPEFWDDFAKMKGERGTSAC